jgi:hypothetical protein
MSSFNQTKAQLEDLADRLQLRNKTVAHAVHILEILDKEHRGCLQKLKPLDVAASCLYIAGLLMGEGPTQNDLCRATDWKISNTTMRRHYRNIAEKLQLRALLAISKSRRRLGREEYFCPLCGEPTKNLNLWKSHLEHDHQLRGWGQSMVRSRDFDVEGNLVNTQFMDRILEAERQRVQAKEMLERIDK